MVCLHPPSPLDWDREDCSKQQKRLSHGQKTLAWIHEGCCRFKSHMWVLLAQSGQEILQTHQLPCVTSSLPAVYARFIQTYLYPILFPFLFNLSELCLSCLSSRKCAVISAVQRKNVNFLKVKKKKSYFNLFSEYYDDRNHQQPTSQEDQLLPQSSSTLYLFFFCFLFISLFILINRSFCSLLFFINTSFLHLLDHIVV